MWQLPMCLPKRHTAPPCFSCRWARAPFRRRRAAKSPCVASSQLVMRILNAGRCSSSRSAGTARRSSFGTTVRHEAYQPTPPYVSSSSYTPYRQPRTPPRMTRSGGRAVRRKPSVPNSSVSSRRMAAFTVAASCDPPAASLTVAASCDPPAGGTQFIASAATANSTPVNSFTYRCNSSAAYFKDGPASFATTMVHAAGFPRSASTSSCAPRAIKPPKTTKTTAHNFFMIHSFQISPHDALQAPGAFGYVADRFLRADGTPGELLLRRIRHDLGQGKVLQAVA